MKFYLKDRVYASSSSCYVIWLAQHLGCIGDKKSAITFDSIKEAKAYIKRNGKLIKDYIIEREK